MDVMVIFGAITASVGCGLLLTWLGCESLFKLFGQPGGRG
jgi:hypothetical protein